MVSRQVHFGEDIGWKSWFAFELDGAGELDGPIKATTFVNGQNFSKTAILRCQ